MTKKDFVEECWILYGLRIGKFFVGYKKYHSKGTAGNVFFDYKTASNPFVIGWKHTHPGIKSIHPSSTDNKTMRSWVKSIYKAFLCGIHCNGQESFYKYSVDGLTKTNVTKVRKKRVKIEFIGSFFVAY